MIRKRREESENGIVKARVSLLEYMIDINKRHPDFTDEDIIDETCTFMLAVRWWDKTFCVDFNAWFIKMDF